MAGNQNFQLISEHQTLFRQDWPLAAALSLLPASANPVEVGEWLEINGQVAARGTSLGPDNEGTSALVYPVYAGKGRTDTQAVGKVPLIRLGMYEAETMVANVAGIGVGDALTVKDGTFGGVAGRRGLDAEAAVAGRVIVGYCSRVIGTTKIRFVHYGYQTR
jgi:hypothetical protein